MTTDKSADETVLDDVFSSERDRGGKSAPSEAATETKAEPQAQQTPAEQPTQEQAQDPETGRMVPLSELTGERKKLKGKLDEESRARIAAEAEAKLLREQLQRFTQQQQPQQAPQRQQVQVPDPVTDPEAYARFVHQTAEQRVFDAKLDASEDRARDKYGDDLVNEAFRAAQAAGLVGPQSPLLQQRHPWGAMVEWHKQQKALQTIGTDPEAYANKIREEERQKVLAELKAGNGLNGNGAQPQRFPGTLADVTATGQQGAHLTDEAVMSSVFSSNRNRRK